MCLPGTADSREHKSRLHTRSTATPDRSALTGSAVARADGTVPGYARPRAAHAVLLIQIDALFSS
jgi:hypothetical protein